MTSKVSRFLQFQRQQAGVLPCNLAAAYLGVSRQTLYKLRKTGKIKTIGTGGVIYYGMNSLNDRKWYMSAKNLKRRHSIESAHIDLDAGEQ
ncbi:MAG: helix-turn-helix domain-containing protein [Verrucomicrobiales bacterium]|nr:helix-turn-helix domain-containing protein [Verrucomicrobiales bacterium]